MMIRIVRVLVALFGAVFLLAGLVSSLDREVEAVVAAKRIVASPISTPSPTPIPEPDGPPECVWLDNPGGDLDWTRRPDAGPKHTGGTVALPSLGVDAPIVKVGVDMNGEMVTPPNARDVAWLDQGPFPGKTNNVVLAGHIAYSRRAGTFNRIKEMSPGNPVVVTLDGRTYTYEVRWICSFSRSTGLAEQIMGRTEVPSVTLITCGGTFDRRAGTHTNRIVVRGELVSVDG